MAKFKIDKTIKLVSPLINFKGEKVSNVRLDGSFTIGEFRNSQYITYDRLSDSWYIDFELIVTEVLSKLEAESSDDNDSTVSTQVQSLNDLIDVLVENPDEGGILRYDQESSTFIISDLSSDLSIINDAIENNSSSISNIDSNLEVLSDRVPYYYYGSDIPGGTGTESIPNGSIWYEPSTGTNNSITYLYIFDGSGYNWVEI
tara:strand:+ start:1824 stop:2429 length:606 start_codon:yes stop_codon:yes gene_type:complete